MKLIRIRSLAAIITTGALAMTGVGLAVSSPASAVVPVLNVSGNWTLDQSNNQTVTVDLTQSTQSTSSPEFVTGTATDIQAGWTGTVSGLLQGDQLTFVVDWNSGKQGEYIINDATASSLDGYGYELDPQITATFTGSRS
jgi:hypothetical protein